MLGIINVATGAMLGIILADSPAFKVKVLGDLSLTLFFVVLVILQAVNIWAASSAIARQAFDFVLVSILLFVGMQIAVFSYFCLSSTSQGIAFDFANHSYAWTFLVVSSAWFASNVVAAWLTHET